MKTRISAMMCLLCVLGSADLTWAEDPYSQRVADPYALSPDPPTMSSGTPELYFSFLTGYANTSSTDATFTDGTQPTVVKDVDYRKNFSLGGNAGIWFPTRNKLWGFDLGVELTGFLWQADVGWRQENFNGVTLPDGSFQGTTTEVQGLYIGPNFLVRYPMAISEAYPNGRWFPYVGIGVGMHQMAMRPGGSRGVNGDITGTGNPITDQRDTTVGFLGMGGVKAHLFKYVAAFAEAKYVHAHHDGLTTDRFGLSTPFGANLTVNQYSSSIDTIFVHAGLSLHFDVKP
ncbi:MAG: hypothetical protein H8K07_06410 [Nitrospira sp.]|jgi:hypothetical protein|nr:hypothetical protein [Nitrospira sp.]MDI3464691.1 hypothetical protein [Nitrospira sp.]